MTISQIMFNQFVLTPLSKAFSGVHSQHAREDREPRARGPFGRSASSSFNHVKEVDIMCFVLFQQPPQYVF